LGSDITGGIQIVFENRVVKRILEPKRNEVTEGWRKLHKEELFDLHSTPSTIRIIKSRTVKLSGHVAECERRGTCTAYL
jgi:hypothetical protein